MAEGSSEDSIAIIGMRRRADRMTTRADRQNPTGKRAGTADTQVASEKAAHQRSQSDKGDSKKSRGSARSRSSRKSRKKASSNSRQPMPKLNMRVRSADYHALRRVWNSLTSNAPSKGESLVESLSAEQQQVWQKAIQEIKIKYGELATVGKRVKYPEDLPISGHQTALQEALREHQILLIEGETGSGKTTQLPKMCLEAGYGVSGMIGVTQPRRVAAFGVSRRIAEELEVKWGETIGCRVRLHDHTTVTTAIKVMTDGVLLGELHRDPLLRAYEVIIIDEAHERSLNIDLLLGVLRRIVEKRKDLKVIITSATLNSERFKAAFPEAYHLQVSGRTYPVTVCYEPLSSEETPQDGVVRCVGEQVSKQPTGDILIFLPTERDIVETVEVLNSRYPHLEVLPLYGRLSSSRQQAVLRPGKRRRIVVATNIAETSLTIPGITCVIDSGLARISRYSPRSRTTGLPVEKVSQSSAAQRAGRAGRVRAGECVRLFSEEDFLAREEHTEPELLRSNLAEVVLTMKARKLGPALEFPFIDPPRPNAVRTGEQVLQELGALESNGSLTKLGHSLTKLPIDPLLGRMLLEAAKWGCLEDVVGIVSVLAVGDPRVRPQGEEGRADQAHRKWRCEGSDFMTLLKVREGYEKCSGSSARKRFCKEHYLSLRKMIEWDDTIRLVRRAASGVINRSVNHEFPEEQERSDAVHRSVLSGLVGQLAWQTDDGRYQASRNRVGVPFPSSVLSLRNAKSKEAKHRQKSSSGRSRVRGKWLMAHEIVQSSRLYFRTCARVKTEWVVEVASHLCNRRYENPRFERRRGEVVATEIITLYGAELQRSSVSYAQIDLEESCRIFTECFLVQEVHGQLTEAAHGNNKRPHGRGYKPSQWIRTNQSTYKSVRDDTARARSVSQGELEDRLVQFYLKELPRIYSVKALKNFERKIESKKVKATPLTPEDLFATSEDSTSVGTTTHRTEAIGPLLQKPRFLYDLDAQDDGVSLTLSIHDFKHLTVEAACGMVPALYEQQLRELLRLLPKTYRKQLVPVPDTVRELLNDLSPEATFYRSVREALASRLQCSKAEIQFRFEELPAHLRPWIKVRNEQGKIAVEGRVPEVLRLSESAEVSDSERNWEDRVRKRRTAVSAQALLDLPHSEAEAGKLSDGTPAWWGVVVDSEQLEFSLFPTAVAANQSVQANQLKLVELLLDQERKALLSAVKSVRLPKRLHLPWHTKESLQGEYLCFVLRTAVQDAPLWPLERASDKERLAALVEQVREKRGRYLVLVEACAEAHAQAVIPASVGSAWQARLQAEKALLLPKDLLSWASESHVARIPQLMDAFSYRVGRLGDNPSHEARCAETMARCQNALKNSSIYTASSEKEKVARLRWELSELYVSLYAQHLKAAFPISEKRFLKNLH